MCEKNGFNLSQIKISDFVSGSTFQGKKSLNELSRYTYIEFNGKNRYRYQISNASNCSYQGLFYS